MAKKEVKKTAKRKSARKTTSKKKTTVKQINLPEVKRGDESQKILLENFVGLQSVMATLSSRLNDLTEKLSRLLDLFESSAKAITEKEGLISELGGNKEVSEKLNKLLDQNKVLAQGIALLHETNQQQYQSSEMENLPEQQQPERPPQPHAPMIPPSAGMQKSQTTSNYQRSISSKY